MPSIADLCHELPVATFAPGEVLIGEGKSTGRLYVLIEGSVAVMKGDFQINLVSEPGAIFGDMSVLLGIPHMATVRAVTPCRARVTEDGAAFLQSHKEVTYLLSQMLAQRLQGVTTYLVDIKRQFEDHSGHLGMVDEILETLLNQQRSTFSPGSDRDEPEM
ncbi:MAG: cyclic nucleotide-binding domain-containing protein [Terricaulis sp.]